MTAPRTAPATPKYLVSTDLDGTLLDHHTYAWEAAKPALAFLHEQHIPVIFNTSKTLAEALALQKTMGICQAVIVENGSALAIPKTQLPLFFPKGIHQALTEAEQHSILTFGQPRAEILQFIAQQKDQLGPILESYNDWSIETIAEKTGLPLTTAKLSAAKDYSEPFIWLSNEQTFERFQHNAKQAGLAITQGGRFYHLLGDTNKAKPLQWLCEQLAQPTLICLGDNKNDIAMLNAANIPVCVKSPTGPYPSIKANPNTIFTEGYGPIGWNEAITKIFNNKSG